eukprot:CAMPEP_0115868362 /NCGR_PEP_ID=MMETSP0287-20121206/21255_1 /TAXON_ID=412157 /ORGANISM="Chrysochromulina rotalis, Strain UIO044" /LENGTH=270 /DNA_ID=CAMNT_0003323017 /DNA_START=248 /DNA_END=1060 /DNA_ORIENTATION=+
MLWPYSLCALIGVHSYHVIHSFAGGVGVLRVWLRANDDDAYATRRSGATLPDRAAQGRCRGLLGPQPTRTRNIGDEDGVGGVARRRARGGVVGLWGFGSECLRNSCSCQRRCAATLVVRHDRLEDERVQLACCLGRLGEAPLIVVHEVVIAVSEALRGGEAREGYHRKIIRDRIVFLREFPRGDQRAAEDLRRRVAQQLVAIDRQVDEEHHAVLDGAVERHRAWEAGKQRLEEDMGQDDMEFPLERLENGGLHGSKVLGGRGVVVDDDEL